MESREVIRQQIFEVIRNQIESNTPPEAKQTLKRLMETGYSDEDARMLIGQCVAVELFSVIKHSEPFNIDRYVLNLKNLPAEPFDD